MVLGSYLVLSRAWFLVLGGTRPGQAVAKDPGTKDDQGRRTDQERRPKDKSVTPKRKLLQASRAAGSQLQNVGSRDIGTIDWRPFEGRRLGEERGNRIRPSAREQILL